MAVAQYLANLIGWTTRRKILVIESDDWGSIRIPSKQVRDAFIRDGIRLDNNIFSNFDSLESSTDVEVLQQTLENGPEDKYGYKPKFTMLSLTHNPDFEKIQATGRKEYFNETVDVTFNRYGYNTLCTLRQVFDWGLITAGLHGREHLNIRMWMKALNDDRFSGTKRAFEKGFYGIHPSIIGEDRKDFQAAFELSDETEIKEQKQILAEACASFHDLYGFSPRFFVPPNGPYSDALDTTIVKSGIEFISAAKRRLEPLGEDRNRRRVHYLGQKKPSGLTVLTRNVIFEPCRGGDEEINRALSSIEISFRMRKPAVISSHRVNYVGGLEEKNRIKSNRRLYLLLAKVAQKWPDVEFMTSVELGNVIKQTK